MTVEALPHMGCGRNGDASALDGEGMDGEQQPLRGAEQQEQLVVRYAPQTLLLSRQ